MYPQPTFLVAFCWFVAFRTGKGCLGVLGDVALGFWGLPFQDVSGLGFGKFASLGRWGFMGLFRVRKQEV